MTGLHAHCRVPGRRQVHCVLHNCVQQTIIPTKKLVLYAKLPFLKLMTIVDLFAVHSLNSLIFVRI